MLIKRRKKYKILLKWNLHDNSIYYILTIIESVKSTVSVFDRNETDYIGFGVKDTLCSFSDLTPFSVDN